MYLITEVFGKLKSAQEIVCAKEAISLLLRSIKNIQIFQKDADLKTDQIVPKVFEEFQVLLKSWLNNHIGESFGHYYIFMKTEVGKEIKVM